MGHCLSKMKFSSGVVSSNSLSLKQSNSIKANSTAAPCSGCNLLTVIVYNSPTYLRNDYTKSFGGSAIISYNDALNVISGGSGTTSDMMTYLSFVSIPNGQCVFGSLAYLGTILGGNSDVSFYINQWAVENKVSPAQMTNSLINDSGSRPNGDGAIFLLTKNFISSRLSTTSDIINNAKLGLPIFVLIDWGNGSGHCVVVLWDDVKNNLYYYDSTQNPPSNYVPFDTNSDIFKKMKVFIAVTDSKI